MSSIKNRSTRELEDIALEIEADLKDGRLSRREEMVAKRDLDLIMDELDYRDKNDRRPAERSYGNAYGRNDSTKDVGSYFNKTSEVSMSAGSIFGGSKDKGLNKGFIPESKDSPKERDVSRKEESRGDTKEHKVFYSPKYPFVTSPNVKEVLEETTQSDNKTIWHIKKREFTGNDDALEFAFKYEHKWEINPLFNNVPEIAYISDMVNPKIPKTVLPTSQDNEIMDINYNNKTINRFIFNEISLDMTNCIQAIDYYIKLKDLEDIKSFLNKPDFKTEYLKHISKIYKSFKIDIKDDCLELNLNKKHIYANIPDLVIPIESDRYFVSEVSNETLYNLIKSISREYNCYIGLIEGFDYKFNFYVGYNKILLVRA